MATGIGETLRAARRQRGRSLADAAAQTRVRETYLAALEEEEFAALGGDVYVKGFLRSYAKYLGIDPEPLVETYRRHYERPEPVTSIARQPVAPVARERPPQLGVLAALAGLVVVILAFIGLNAGEDTGGGPVQAPPPVPTATRTTAPEPARTQAEPTATEPVVSNALKVVLSVEGGESYVRTIEGEPRIERTLSDGDSETFTGADEVALRIGNAGAVRVVVDGQDQGRLGSSGQPLTVVCRRGASTCETTG